jgi:hypothetical protein
MERLQTRMQRTGTARSTSLSAHAGTLTVAAVVLSIGFGGGVTTRPGLILLALSVLIAFLVPAWVPLTVALIGAWFRSFVPELPSGLLVSDVALGIFVLRVVAPLLLFGQDRRLQASSWWLLAFLAWAWIAMLFNGGEEYLALARITEYGAVFVAASLTRGMSRPVFILAALAAATQVAIFLASGVLAVGDLHQFGQVGMAGIAGAQFIRHRLWRATLFLASLAGIVLCFRRGIWIAGAVEIGVLALPLLRRREGRVRLVLGMLLGIIVAVGMYQAQETLTSRLGLNVKSIIIRQEGWSDAITAIRAEPLFGHGWATALDGGQPAYNLFLNVAASVGIVGALLVIGFLAALALRLTVRAGRESRAVFAFLLGFLVLSMAEMTFYAAAAGTLAFFVLMGSTVGARFERRPGVAIARRNPFLTPLTRATADPGPRVEPA